MVTSLSRAARSYLPWLAVIPMAACSFLGDKRDPAVTEARCRAAGAEAFLGQEADERVVAEARAAAGGLRSRVLPPSAMATLDADPMRLNIEVDASNRIRRMRCG